MSWSMLASPLHRSRSIFRHAASRYAAEQRIVTWTKFINAIIARDP
jgi:hypothetical protein